MPPRTRPPRKPTNRTGREAPQTSPNWFPGAPAPAWGGDVQESPNPTMPSSSLAPVTQPTSVNNPNAWFPGAPAPAWTYPTPKPPKDEMDDVPAWMPQPTGSFFGGGGQFVQGQDGQPVSAAPQPRPTGTFFGGGGNVVRGGGGQGISLSAPRRPTGTFFGGGGQAIRSNDPASNNTYWLPQVPADRLTTSVIGGGGQLVNTGNPIFPVAPPLEDQPTGGFGSTYARWRRGRGGGYGGYGGGGYDNMPSSYLNLFNWNTSE